MMVPVPSLVALTSMAMVTAVASVSGFVQHTPPAASLRGATAMEQPVAVDLPLMLPTRSLSSSRRTSCLLASFDDSSSSNSNNNRDQQSPSPSDTDSNNNNNLPTNSNSNTRYTTNQYHGIELPSADEMDNSISELRQLRWEREAYILSKFASGDELQELRKEGSRIRQELEEWRAASSSSSKAASAAAGQSSKVSSYIHNLEKQLLQINERDAEFMYCIAKELMIQARNEGDAVLEQKYEVQMKEAVLGIPQLNMHGLWVGKYGDHGYEMINITYSGETLIATKVTGDRNVPKGEVTFTVDLAPQILSSYASSSSSSSSDGHQNQQQQQQHYHYVSSTLEPIQLDAKAQSQWGKKYLPRFTGKGRVASENFTNAQWMEGQLILVGRFFSFAWVPIGTQIFFGRPSSDLILSMVNEDRKEEMKKRDDVEVMRSVVNDMWEETYWVEKENVQDVLYEEDGCFQ